MVVVLLDEVLPLDYAIPLHVFAREAPEAYDVVTASLDGRPVPVAGGTTVVPDGGLDLLRKAATVIVPGYAGAADGRLPGMLLRALAAAHRRGARMISICSGAFALAEAGVLNGLTVTTHWSLCDELATRFPALTVDGSLLVAGTGPVLTSGGVTAGVDLCLRVLHAVPPRHERFPARAPPPVRLRPGGLTTWPGTGMTTATRAVANASPRPPGRYGPGRTAT